MAEFIRIDSRKLKQNAAALKNLKNTFKAGPDITVANSKTFFRSMQKEARYAYEATKDYIKNQAKTPTGIRRGDPQGRYDKGDMYKAFKPAPGGGRTSVKKGGQRGSVKFYYEMGWLDGMPDYTLFQEYGTSRGIEAMNAIGWGQQAIEDYVRGALAHSKAEYARQLAEGWAIALRTGTLNRSYRPGAAWWAKSAADEGDD